MTSPSAGREKLLRWYAKQDEVLQLRIRLLACQVAELKGTSTGQELPGACRGAREGDVRFHSGLAGKALAKLPRQRGRDQPQCSRAVPAPGEEAAPALRAARTRNHRGAKEGRYELLMHPAGA